MSLQTLVTNCFSVDFLRESYQMTSKELGNFHILTLTSNCVSNFEFPNHISIPLLGRQVIMTDRQVCRTLSQAIMLSALCRTPCRITIIRGTRLQDLTACEKPHICKPGLDNIDTVCHFIMFCFKFLSSFWSDRCGNL